MALASACLFAAGAARAQRGGPARGAEGSLHIYADDDEVTVITPSASAWTPLSNTLAFDVATTVDVVTAASVDVVTQASPYREERKESSLGLNLLRDEFLVGIDYTNSSEKDYTSNALTASLSHDLFDKNVTLNFRYGRSWDEVGKNGDPSFGWQDFDRTTYTAGFSQILSPQWVMQFNYEATADSGFINNPYRSVLTVDGGTVPENYPEARTGQAWLIRTVYGSFTNAKDAVYSGNKRSIQLDYRYYQDTFGIQSHTGKILIQRYWRQHWLYGLFYQYYWQDEANFYGDSLPTTQEFKARDKELSRFSDHWIGGSLKYKPSAWPGKWMENPFIQFGYSFIMFHYDNFTDPRTGELYQQDSHVLHTSIGFNY